MAAQTNVRVGGSSAKSRQFKYDFVRFVAMTWVIGVHRMTPWILVRGLVPSSLLHG